jgi:hypothetical protein
MTQYIAYPNETCVSLVIPTGDLSIEQVVQKDVPPNVSYIFVTDEDLLDNDFYNAWEIVSKKLQINLDKAKEIHRDKIRAARTPLLSKLDVQFQRALETSADTKDIVAQKQALRDATEDSKIAAATTTDAIKASWNTELLGDSPYQQ